MEKILIEMFEAPEMEIIMFDTEDVITDSNMLEWDWE